MIAGSGCLALVKSAFDEMFGLLLQLSSLFVIYACLKTHTSEFGDIDYEVATLSWSETRG